MAFKMALVVLALIPALLPSLSIASATDVTAPPRISVEQIRSTLSSQSPPSDEHPGTINLHRTLYDSHGILRIAVGGGSDYDGVILNSFSEIRKRALRHMCDCPTFNSSTSSSTIRRNTGAVTTFDEAAKSHPKDLQQITLPDGTVRRTLASATVGFGENDAHKGTAHAATVLELPSWVEDTCGRDAYNSFEDLRDAVADVVGMFVERLDQEKYLSKRGMKSEGEMEQSYQQILSGANHLEHFHVYTKTANPVGRISSETGAKDGGDRVNGHIYGNHPSSDKDTSTLDYHTDAGFFLSFVPAMDCQSYSTDNSSFFLERKAEPLTFEEDEVVIMMGAGAQYWLPDEGQKDHPFLAASHALRLSQNTHRTWYGKMHLLPSSLTSRNAQQGMKYRKALESFQLEDYDAHVPASSVDGCGTIVFNDNNGIPSLSHDVMVQKKSRRRLQHVNSPANCNNVTNFFCWHQCVNIPDSEHAEEYVQDGYSLYCLDPAILASSSSIPEATAPCEEGYVHNPSCSGKWQETDDSVPGYKLPYKSYPIPDTEEKYCYGGTSMYMDGFNWQGTTCVIYLFQSWVLSTPGKFALAIVGSILFGVTLEFVLWKRRSVYTLSPGLRRLFLSAFVYGLQLTMGYFIMLVVMTYSGPLFISTIGGMMLGHCLFNAQDSIVKRREAKKNRANENQEGTAFRDIDRTPETTEVGSRTELGSYQNGGSYQHGDNDSEIADCCGAKPPADESTKLRDAVADGATPCCQYTL